MTKKSLDNAASYKNVHWSFWVGVVFFVAVIITIFSVSLLLNKRVTAEESMPVTSIVISGEMDYTNKLDIEKALEAVDLGNFFKLDVNQVQNEVVQLPWVYSVSVRKKWPNELKIYVVDQTPIARWNDDFFINQFGKAFQANAERVEHKLPAFFGPEGSELVALERYKTLSESLTKSALFIDELMLSERYSWRLTLNDGVTLNLGREDNEVRVQRFIGVYDEIKNNQKEEQQVDYIDLRYDTGLAVGWKPKALKERV